MKYIFVMMLFFLSLESTVYAHGGQLVLMHLSMMLVAWIIALVLIVLGPFQKHRKRQIFGGFFVLSLMLALISPPPIFAGVNLVFFGFLGWKVFQKHSLREKENKGLS